MLTLNNKNFKKNDKIILVTPWNHHYNLEDRKSKDSYNVKKWIIGSIGKKQMHLIDSDGTKGDQFYADKNGNFLTYWQNTDVQFFAINEEEIQATINILRENDKYKTSEFEIKNIRF